MAPIGLRIFHRTKLSGDSQPTVRTLYSYDDLSQFSYFFRNTVQDAINFSSDLVAKNVQEGIHSAIEYQGNFVYALCKDNLVVAYICNEAYNDRVANSLLNKFYDMFISKYPLNTWSTISPNKLLSTVLVREPSLIYRCYVTLADSALVDTSRNKIINIFENYLQIQSCLEEPFLQKNSVDFPQIQTLFEQSKNPVEVDKMEQIKKNLDDTTCIMHQNIESILSRGEKLDILVSKSELLSSQSKQFYKTAKKTNSCCMIL